ncbi:MAG: hypothetical protein CBR30_01315 [Dictyoglomus sp. NZ13-RE01]|nr:MAG: hypothetical protein CBR30_01315 [Dictyoglomus sp. NZ13-RE01]
MRTKIISLLILAFLLIPIYTWAVTFEDPITSLAKDPRALGMAGAMTALGDSPTSAIFNPALMGEYNSFTLKAGLGSAPVDETTLESLNKFVEYLKMFMNDQEPPDDELSGNVFLTGYANLGIGRVGLTLWGDASPSFNYYKATYTTYTLFEANVYLDSNFDANGALTIALPIINSRDLKLSVGANFRVNINGYAKPIKIDSKLTPAGLALETYSENTGFENYLKVEDYEELYKYWVLDLGGYLKLSDNFALGISAQNVYGQGIEGDIHHHIKYYHWEIDTQSGEPILVYDSTYTDGPYYISSDQINIPPLTLKAGALLKVPTLNTRVAFDVDLNNNFQPVLYRLGVEQPLLVFVVRGGAILDPNFTPLYYTLGAGVNLLFIRVDAGLGYLAQGSIVETIQNTQPLVASISGSIQF